MSTKRDAQPSDSDSTAKKQKLNDHEEHDSRSETEVDDEWPFQTSVTVLRTESTTGTQHNDFPVNPELIMMVTWFLGTNNFACKCGVRCLGVKFLQFRQREN